MAAVGYEADYYAWAERQAEMLRLEEFTEIDWRNLAEEIEAMAISQRRELTSRLRVLIMHLMKWQWQPEHRSRSWQHTISAQRDELEDLLSDSPSLRILLDERIAKAYPRARREAIREMGLLDSPFPPECPYVPEEILDSNFWPQGEK